MSIRPIGTRCRLALLPLIVIAFARAADCSAKDETGSYTAGPPAPLSAEQRAQLEAKRLARMQGVTPAVSTTKVREIVTIGEPTGVAIKAAPTPGPIAAGPVPLDVAEVRALELLRITLPIEVLRAAGLVKPESRGSSGVQR